MGADAPEMLKEGHSTGTWGLAPPYRANYSRYSGFSSFQNCQKQPKIPLLLDILAMLANFQLQRASPLTLCHGVLPMDPAGRSATRDPVGPALAICPRHTGATPPENNFSLALAATRFYTSISHFTFTFNHCMLYVA